MSNEKINRQRRARRAYRRMKQDREKKAKEQYLIRMGLVKPKFKPLPLFGLPK